LFFSDAVCTRQNAASAKGFVVGLEVVVYANSANDDAFWVERHREIKLLPRCCYHNPANLTEPPSPVLAPLPRFSLRGNTGPRLTSPRHPFHYTHRVQPSRRKRSRVTALLPVVKSPDHLYHPQANGWHSLFPHIVTAAMGLFLFHECHPLFTVLIRPSRIGVVERKNIITCSYILTLHFLLALVFFRHSKPCSVSHSKMLIILNELIL